MYDQKQTRISEHLVGKQEKMNGTGEKNQFK